jgi:hypothetical protein
LLDERWLPLGSVANNLQLGGAINAREDRIDTTEHTVFEEILYTILTLQHRKIFENDDRLFAYLEREIAVYRPQLISTDSTFH